MIAAAVDLPINQSLGFAWIVPYRVRGKKMAQFQMGYKGYVQLALRTGQYSRLNVCAVYEGELIGANKLTGDITLDETKRTGDKIIGYASYMKLVSGFEHAEYWSVDTVRDHAEKYSQSFRSGAESPWKTNFDQMAMKTVLSSHIRHWGPMTVSVQRAAEADGAVMTDAEAAPDYVDNGKQESPARTPQLGEREPEAETPEEIIGSDSPLADPAPSASPIIELKQPEASPEIPKDTSKTEMSIGPHQSNLIALIEGFGVKMNLFTNYIMVNGVDKKYGFDSVKAGPISNWPDNACESIGKDSALMARIVQKFVKK